MRAANYEMQNRERAIKDNQYNPTQKAEQQLTAAEKIIQQYIS